MGLLRKIRLENELTLRDIEEITGISNAYNSQLESGKIGKPSIEVMYKLSKVYNVDFLELLIGCGLLEENPAIKSLNRGKTVSEKIEDLKQDINNIKSNTMNALERMAVEKIEQLLHEIRRECDDPNNAERQGQYVVQPIRRNAKEALELINALKENNKINP